MVSKEREKGGGGGLPFEKSKSVHFFNLRATPISKLHSYLENRRNWQLNDNFHISLTQLGDKIAWGDIFFLQIFQGLYILASLKSDVGVGTVKERMEKSIYETTYSGMLNGSNAFKKDNFKRNVFNFHNLNTKKLLSSSGEGTLGKESQIALVLYTLLSIQATRLGSAQFICQEIW